MGHSILTEYSILYVNIDIGKKGGIAVNDAEGEVLLTHMMPVTPDNHYDSRGIHELFLRIRHSRPHFIFVVTIEEPIKIPRNNPVQRGASFGFIRGIADIVYHDQRIEEINPKTWTQAMFGSHKNKNKQATEALARRLFPALFAATASTTNLTLVGPNGGFRDGPADACLMGAYQRAKNQGLAVPTLEENK